MHHRASPTAMNASPPGAADPLAHAHDHSVLIATDDASGLRVSCSSLPGNDGKMVS
jgi:hypothetical protein